ncbi:MAG: tail fiber domain-containing protein [Bacteroidetes bacterium]|nr:tail fiber domain-containing protein [Bacteroidota bacterium]MBU1115649.1 tail fiber domain-containing protein [Bacteroidota bacterium]MBU1799965.1 tail fiber domain-containing protein [Bacteroidota bacterium]
MKKLLLTLTFALIATQLFAQNDITNTLGATGKFYIKSGSTEQNLVTVDEATGNVGIGTATPVNRFEVSGSTFNRITASVTADVQSGFQIIRTADANDVNWEMYTPAGSTNLRIAKKLPADGASTDILTFQDNGNVGIGTTSPNAKLDVRGGNVSTDFRITRDPVAAPNTYTYITAPGNDPGAAFIGVSDNTYGSTIVQTMTAQGRVGIGTTTPYSKLEVQDKIIAGDETSTNGSTIIEGHYSQSSNDVVNTLGSMFGSGAWLMGYCMRPKSGSSGYISSADNATFERSGMELSNRFFKLHYAPTQSTTVGNDITGLTTPFYVDLENAKVGINTTSPSYRLYVNGTSGGTNAWTNDSDKRLKKDVNLIENGLDKVMKLRPITFYWKQSEFPKRNYDDRNHVGFIAQEVEVVVPQVVSTADDEMKTKSIAYSDLVPVLTKAIQEQQKLIEELRDRISNLENK